MKFAAAKLLQMSGTVSAHNNAPVADADLAVGAATFELPIGELLLQAAGPLLFSQFGGAKDLNGALQNLVDCASFGQTISDGLGGYVAPAEGEKLCTAGIGLVAAAVTLKIKAITFDGIEVKSANAKLYDVTLQKPTEDYQSDRIAEGQWTWTFTVGGKSASVPATFSGDRVGTAN